LRPIEVRNALNPHNIRGDGDPSPPARMDTDRAPIVRGDHASRSRSVISGGFGRRNNLAMN